jgi:MFS family permease
MKKLSFIATVTGRGLTGSVTAPPPARPASDPARPLGQLAILVMVLLPFALAHGLSNLFRTVNAVVYTDLAADLTLAGSSLGLLTGSYFLSFALAQLPVGVALDRFGPRKVQGPLLLLAAVGAVLFAQAHTLTELVLARGMIGLGVAGSMMAALKAGSQWLPADRLPTLTSGLLVVGGMGSMLSTAPVQAALGHTDWRGLFIALGFVTVGVAALIYLTVPELARKPQTTRLTDMVKAVGQIYRAPSFWRVALYSLVAHASCIAIQGLWLGPWLRDVGHMSRAEVANGLFLVTAAMMAGSVFFGWLTTWLRRRGHGPMLACGLGLCLFAACQLLMVAGVPLPPLALAMGFSFFGIAASMNFAIVAQSVPSHLTGRASTAFNLLVCLLAFLLQWGLGALLGLWPTEDGHYAASAYRVALGLCLALQAPGLLLWFSFKPWRRSAAA